MNHFPVILTLNFALENYCTLIFFIYFFEHWAVTYEINRPNYTVYDCNYTKYVSLKNAVSINFSRVITTFWGLDSVCEQKNSSSSNQVPITVKMIFPWGSSP